MRSDRKLCELRKKTRKKQRKTIFFEKMHAAPGARVLSIYHMRWAPLAMVSARNRVPSIYHMRWAPITRFFDAHSDQKIRCFLNFERRIEEFPALCAILNGEFRNFKHRSISRQQKCPLWQDSHMVSLQERSANQQQKIFKKV